MIGQSSVVYRKTLSEMIQSLNALNCFEVHIKLGQGSASANSRQERIMIEMTGFSMNRWKMTHPQNIISHLRLLPGSQYYELTDTFQKAIVFYLNNKPLLKKIREEQMVFYNEKLNFTKGNLLSWIVCKQSIIDFCHFKNTTTYYSNNVDPSTIYKQANDLINEKGTTINWLSQNSKPIQVIDEFKSPTQPQSYSRFKYLIYGALIGLGICFFLGLYIELYRKTKNYKGKSIVLSLRELNPPKQ